MATVGEILRRERTRRGLTIHNAQEVLHIRSAYLEALEEDRYDLIPGDVYAKGFIRNYANYLGLNGQELVDTFKMHKGEPLLYQVRTIPKAKRKSISTQEEKEVHKRLHIESRQERKKKRRLQEQVFAAGFLVFVILFIAYLFWL